MRPRTRPTGSKGQSERTAAKAVVFSGSEEQKPIVTDRSKVLTAVTVQDKGKEGNKHKDVQWAGGGEGSTKKQAQRQTMSPTMKFRRSCFFSRCYLPVDSTVVAYIPGFMTNLVSGDALKYEDSAIVASKTNPLLYHGTRWPLDSHAASNAA